MSESPFPALIGEDLDTVSFVRDYVELRINYAIVRALTDPTGVIDGVPWAFPEEGSADLMRRYINRVLVAAELVPDDHILLTFDGDATFLISLRWEDRVGPEAAHFVPPDERGQPGVAAMWVW